MPLQDGDLRKISAEELKVLDGVIDYAERMIYEDGNGSAYRPMRRHAYGKTVVIQTERQGILTFRLSPSSAVYPDTASGYATPHSPVGRLCSALRCGDEDETPRWGAYQVLQVRLFDRFDGAQFEPNVRNFLHMTVVSEGGNPPKVTNLAQFLSHSGKVSRSREVDAPIPDEPVARPAPRTATPAKPVAPPAPAPAPAAITITTLAIIDDDEDLPGTVDLEDEDVAEVPASSTAQDEAYFGLSESFFVNRTREQDEVMSRSPIGPMFVQGVAGSGKTSAALGRTKMLCDFNVRNVSDSEAEAEFRDIAGHSLAFWSGKYAGQFSQDSSVGFVRTSELIHYLKETCRRLELPHLPVKEFPELRSDLLRHRKVERTRPGSPRWTRTPEHRPSCNETTMKWLRAADRAVARHWARALPMAFTSTDQVISPFTKEHRDRALRVSRIALARLQVELSPLASELSLRVSKGFALDRLASRVQTCIDQVRKTVLGKDVLWVTIAEQTWTSTDEQQMAGQLVQARVPLYLRTQARLVFLNDLGPVDASLSLLTPEGQRLTWNEECRKLLEQGKVLVRDASGLTTLAKASGTNDLFFRLMPEATEKLYVMRGGALRPLGLQRGLGKERLELQPSAAAAAAAVAKEEEPDLDDPEDTLEEQGEILKYRSVDSQFHRVARRLLLQPLSRLADAYCDALVEHGDLFPDKVVARAIVDQLQQRKLTESDFDLLLCLAHLIGRGFSGFPATLREPDFYQAVFIDEVQDFTEQQVFLMSEQANPAYRAVTVVGDTAQKLHNGNTINLSACFPNESLPVVHLTENLRQLAAPGLAWFSACFRAKLQDRQPGALPSPVLAECLRANAGCLRGPELVGVEDETELADLLVEALLKVPPGQTAAVILPDAESASTCFDLCKNELSARLVDAELSRQIDLSRRHVRHFTSVTNAKGLEFDVVIVPYLERYDLDDSGAVNRLYVALTRARRKLVLLEDVARPASVFDTVWGRYEDSLSSLCADAATA